MSQKILLLEFQKVFGNSFAKELLFEFEKSKSTYWLGDITKGLLHAARFSEICIACLKKVSEPSINIDLNKIKFGKFYNDLQKLLSKIFFFFIFYFFNSIFINNSTFC